MNDYAKHLPKRNNPKLPPGTAKKPSGRKKLRTISVLIEKKQTIREANQTLINFNFHKKRWNELFSKPLNKWTPTLQTSTTR